MRSPIIILSATILYAVIHSLLATLKAKAGARNLFGPSSDRWYRLAYNIFAGISFLPILWLMAVLPDQRLYMVPFPWVVFTSLGQIAGVIIIVLGIWQADAFSFLGISQLFEKQPSAKTSALVVTGLYHRMRHPLYTGGLIVLWLTPFMSVNTLTLIIVLSIYLVVGAIFEEHRLLHEFGENYAAYQKQVPMIIPSLPVNDDDTKK